MRAVEPGVAVHPLAEHGALAVKIARLIAIALVSDFAILDMDGEATRQNVSPASQLQLDRVNLSFYVASSGFIGVGLRI